MPHKSAHFWRPWRQHWLFVAALFVLGPACGYWLSADRGLLFGLGISVFASAWLLWSRYGREVE